MTPHQERRVLSALLKRAERSVVTSTAARFACLVLWLLLVGAFMALFQLAPHAGRSVLYIAVGSAVLGAIGAWLLFYLAALKQWPLIQAHLNAESIRNRLRELET